MLYFLDHYLHPKYKGTNWFFPVLLLIKEYFNLTGWDTIGHTQPKNGSLRCYLSLMTISMQMKTEVTWFYPQIFMIKESCNLIGWEAYLATSNQSSSLPCCLPLMTDSMQKKQDITWFFTELLNHKLLQWDCMKGKTGHTQPKKVVRDVTFAW